MTCDYDGTQKFVFCSIKVTFTVIALCFCLKDNGGDQCRTMQLHSIVDHFLHKSENLCDFFIASETEISNADLFICYYKFSFHNSL